jgi:hypothetical protein
MHCFRLIFLIIIAGPVWAVEDFVVGGGIQSDSDDGISGVILADVGLTEKTRLNGSYGKSNVPLPTRIDMNTSYGDVGLDHWFDPVGIRVFAAYWGDNDIFDSVDSGGAVYWRNDKFSLSADLEYRDFEFDIFRDDVVPGQDVRFHAKGAGLSARARIGDSVSLRLSGINYRYNVNLRLDANRRIIDLLSVSRLSLISSLIDYRVGAGIDIDAGKRTWSLDYLTWKGEVDGSTTHSATLHFLTPLGSKSDIDFGLGVDNSDLYGSATFFSVFLYFYGGT